MKRMSIVVAALAGAACTTEDPGRLPLVQEPIAVTVSYELRAPTLASHPAAIESERTAQIATRMSGTVTSVGVDVGARVRAGQTLFTVDAQDVAAGVAAGEAQLELAERSYARIESLAGDGAASQQELDQARASLESARAGLAGARAQETYAVVRAPFAGVVTSRTLDPGDLALPGVPLMTVVAPGALKVVADLPAHRAGALSVGTDVRVSVAGVEDVLVARITRVVPALAPGSRTFRVEASPAGSWVDVLPGAYARLILPEGTDGPRWIPSDAVVERGQLRGVYAVEADTLRLRWVRLGQGRDGAVELLAAPAGAMAVVRNPAANLSDGLPVSDVRVADWDVPLTPPEGLIGSGDPAPGGIDR